MSGVFAMQFRVNLIFVLLASACYIVCHATIGQTPGKIAVGIRVVGLDGSKIGWVEASKRALVNPVANIVPGVGSLLVILNGLWPLWDEKKQSVGDKIARTLVAGSSKAPSRRSW